VLITNFTASSLNSGVNLRYVLPIMDNLSYKVSTKRGQGQTEKFTMTQFGELYRMVQQAVTWEKSHTAHAVTVVSNSSSGEPNIADQLTKLADLFERGVLTEKEFSEAKSRNTRLSHA